MTWGEHYLRKCLSDRQGPASHSGPLSVRDLGASPTSMEPRSPHLHKGILAPVLFPSQGGCEDRIRWCVRKHLDHGKSLMLPSHHPQTLGRRRVILKSSLPSPLWVCTFRKGGVSHSWPLRRKTTVVASLSSGSAQRLGLEALGQPSGSTVLRTLQDTACGPGPLCLTQVWHPA